MEFTASTPSTRALIITGNRRAYFAGQDLSTVSRASSEQDEAKDIHQRNKVTRDLTKLLITSQIPIIAAVNGPAIGYRCTTLALIRNQRYVDKLVQASDAEMDQLDLRMISKDAKQAIAQMFDLIQASGKGQKAKM
ncbi:hypothetical protein GGF38_002532 [Coemansia sp. RSA 25]|nr:hypothetical protein GGF38_002532 [Coemansia sp. RSA 25]